MSTSTARRWLPELGMSLALVGGVVAFYALFAPGMGCRDHALSTWGVSVALDGAMLQVADCGSYAVTVDLRLAVGGLACLFLGWAVTRYSS
ncbi:hypothetical protein [Haloarchaeobius iranensis]|uniref:Uncharacterized protein n=1 Tax=Haloarchaeobius iranensis TaxID=996166 RepID=A0A1H0AXK4_9EURY|nr:hypothetical protein [Haloarchaeobius iranensis]SDN38118.1 hypothetical protein SAMN05192554_13111 [Haloarchaeobius iranensis]